MLRKKGKATQHNRKTKQHNTTRPRQYFSKKKAASGGTCTPYFTVSNETHIHVHTHIHNVHVHCILTLLALVETLCLAVANCLAIWGETSHLLTHCTTNSSSSSGLDYRAHLYLTFANFKVKPTTSDIRAYI